MRAQVTVAAAGLALTLGLAACAGGDETAAEATVKVQLEQLEGILMEGFQLDIAFENSSGVLSTYNWNEDVVQQPADVDDYYDAVLVEQVPAGPIEVVTVLQPGMAPPATECRTPLDLEPGEAVTVTVSFSGVGPGCATVT